MTVFDDLSVDTEALQSLRRDLHAHPELCFAEERTSALIAHRLESLGMQVHRGWGKTGVIGVLDGKPGGKSLGLRADMDALPITEQNHFAHASVHPGKMHACGHDGHIAMLLGAAHHLAAKRDFFGTVYFIFQPAEEGGGGAQAMIAQGLFERFPMDIVLGMHNWPGMPVGQFAIKDGPCFASSNEFKIVIHGKGSHAAMPHLGIDPVPIACQMVQAFQTIVSRNMRPIDTGVVSVTMINAGEASNVVAPTCTLQGTVRSFTNEVLDLIESRMRDIACHTAQAYGAHCEFEFQRNYPPTINDAKVTQFVRRVMTEMVGAAQVLEFEPTMGAEDFSYFLHHKPGAYFLIGNGEGEHRSHGHGLGPCMLHNPCYDFNDALLPLGSALWVRLVEAHLSKGT